MVENPFVGVLFHWLGGASAASFYVPYKRVQRWSWEVYWLTGGAMAWLVAPWVFAALRTDDLLGVLQAAPSRTIFWCYFWGAMWGFGSNAFGLTMRYLGLSLGMAVALVRTSWGQATFVGFALAVAGILIVARSGQAKDSKLGASGTF